MRITLIHAVSTSIPPIEAAFPRLWPEATVPNLRDDSLVPDLQRDWMLTEAMTDRLLVQERYARMTGFDAMLFTCSALGPCIENCARELQTVPALTPNEAIIEETTALTASRGRIGLMAIFEPIPASTPAEFYVVSRHVTVVPCLAAETLAALNAGDSAGHDSAAVRLAPALENCDVIALAEFSPSRAAGAVATATGKTMLTTPDSAVRKLRRLLLTAKAA